LQLLIEQYHQTLHQEPITLRNNNNNKYQQTNI